MTTLSLECSKKIYALIGPFDTQIINMKGVAGWQEYRVDDAIRLLMKNGTYPWLPRPNFAEVVRILPKIGEKKGDVIDMSPNQYSFWSLVMTGLYRDAPSEPEGLQQVDAYLSQLLMG